MRPTRFLALLAAIVVLTPSLRSEDWLQYRGNSGDGKSDATIPDEFKLETAWTQPTPLGFSSFTVAGGKLFTIVSLESDAGKVETVIAMNASDGKEVWKQSLGSGDYKQGGGNAGAPGNRGGDGPRSTPASDGKYVFVYDSHLLLSCFEGATGNLVWQRDIAKEFSGRNIKWLNASSPVLEGQKLYVAGGGSGESFLAFEKSTGDLVWKSGDEMMTHATPTIATINGQKQVVYFTQSGLVSVNADTGEEIWRSKFPFSVSTAASPVVMENLVYCSAGYGVGAGLFQVTESKDAKEVWFKANELMNHWSTPLVDDGYLYGIYEFKKYGRAPLNCVNLKTGEIEWSERGFGPGNCILVGDKLVVLSDSGELVIAKASPDGYKELARRKVVEGKCWSTPSYSDGKIYVRSTVEGACVRVIP